jgi:hypothetical protein
VPPYYDHKWVSHLFLADTRPLFAVPSSLQSKLKKNVLLRRV